MFFVIGIYTLWHNLRFCATPKLRSYTTDISAIIPVYNGKKYLREAVNSVITQTLQPIELILVDDGSLDGSLNEIEGIKTHFPIRVFKQQNSGQSSARNHGIRESTGSFIALLDQDDIWYCQHLEKLVEPFRGNPDLGWVYSNVDQIDEVGRVFRTRLLDFCSFQHPQTHLDEMLRTDMHILPSASLIRRKAFQDVGMFDERLSGYEDDDLFLRLFIKGWGKKYIPESFSQWRIHSNNSGAKTGFKSRRIYAQKIIDTFSASNLFKDFSPAEIIGIRFFNTTLHYYSEYLRVNDFAGCESSWMDLKKYASLAPLFFQKSWKYRLFLRRYPKLFKCFSKIKKLMVR
jgi:glycosyltransferase involved in cell wall biosynthesis